MNNIRDMLIKAGVKNLKEFGYPSVDNKNILTDDLYKEFFISMLKENYTSNEEANKEIDNLLSELK